MYISVKEAAKLSGKSITTIYRLCNKRKDTEYVRREDNKFLIDKEFLLATYPIEITEHTETVSEQPKIDDNTEIIDLETADKMLDLVTNVNNESDENNNEISAEITDTDFASNELLEFGGELSNESENNNTLAINYDIPKLIKVEDSSDSDKQEIVSELNNDLDTTIEFDIHNTITDSQNEEATETTEEENQQSQNEEATEITEEENQQSQSEEATETTEEENQQSQSEEATETTEEEHQQSQNEEATETTEEENQQSQNEEATETTEEENQQTQNEEATEITEKEKIQTQSREATETQIKKVSEQATVKQEAFDDTHKTSQGTETEVVQDDDDEPKTYLQHLLSKEVILGVSGGIVIISAFLYILYLLGS